MTRMYWRPHKVSRIELLLVAVVALGGLTAAERFRVTERQKHYEQKMAAARAAQRGFEVVRTARIALGEINLEVDPLATGLIGPLMSPVTTNHGHLGAKQISVNPNFAALLVQYLKRADVEAGDVVALGLSGSFPAINIAALTAVEAIGAQPVVISSVSASQFGANDPRLTWPDMERVLVERGVVKVRSLALSRGGIEDRALGMPREARALLDAAMERAEVKHIIRPENYAASVETRMKLYTEASQGRPIKVYVNVGGGTVSVGTKVGKRMFKPGLNRTAPTAARQVDSVMTRFAALGVPVVHMSNIADLARRYGFPLEPQAAVAPGLGRIFVRETYSRTLAGGVFATVVLLLVGFVRTDFGFRMLRTAARRPSRKPPERMV